ncbi:putative 2-hydroxyacid dehydrogenase [Actinomadura rubteroloni]|uniref:Putative 2-hydroxyacid dehydrogenase n=1 Tax=Actinomadura rubteroloni TaxID=1926885 RepID=A0A2P4UM09_9ACTN|nr:NAD(P)-dependent oxidoreductase [Actinomadura rubteroloni]POM26082.1 putative 2-hydroxyacid dehydrogenase [Actinomadura rubteroloni]
MTDQWRVLALPPLDVSLLRGLTDPLGGAAELVVPEARTTAALHRAIEDAEIVVGDYTGELALDAAAVAHARRLAFVQMPQVGVDGVDLDALTRAGVPVANTAGANSRAVAEWAVGAAFALCRHLAWADRQVRAGGWPQGELLARGTREIHAQRVGVVGHGAIGALAADLFAALGAPVAYWSRTRRENARAEYRPLDDLLAESDIVVLALPLTGETAGLFDAARIGRMKHGALLVNVARGGIVDENALLAALDDGSLAGAALDVFEHEPPPQDAKLRTHDNVLVSPHVAGGTVQAQLAIIQTVADNVQAAVRGEPVDHVVNGLGPVITRR